LLRIGASHGTIGVGTIDALSQVWPNLDHRIHCDRELCERKLWYEHARQLVMTKVSRGQQDSFLLCYAGGTSITVLNGSSTHRDELVSTGDNDPDFP